MDATADKNFYESELLEGQASSYAPQVVFYARSWIDGCRRELGGRTGLKVLDLGAGSCTLSFVLSKEPFVGEVAAADISAVRLRTMSEETHALIGGDASKLSFHEIDFNKPLPFEDDSFDIVVMDAALHHSRNIWETLAEIRRVLKPGALFVAQREAFTSPLTNRITFRRLLASPEVMAGVSENAYLPSQYDYYFRANGFEPRFIPVYESLKFRLLFFLNGIAFSKYNIVARSTKTA
ncbi:MAG TPA: class I SAM-dependent methyltransferase [Allosphingosinicella sp.]|nr:class I SAM-dependent methyltransferase [Allosphingosinicella sp.]